MPVCKTTLSQIDVTVTIQQGRNLVAKDRALLSRQRTSSDPYVKFYLGGSTEPPPLSSMNLYLGRTAVVSKNCVNPAWNETIHIPCNATLARQVQMGTLNTLWCLILDSDTVTEDDPMGVVAVPLAASSSSATTAWYPVQAGPPSHACHCHNATGEIQVGVQVEGRAVRSLFRGNQMSLERHSAIRVGLAWDIQPGVGAVDLDSSVVALTRDGRVDITETIYYGNLSNPNRSLMHSGDDTTGEGGGDDETIFVDLQRIPSHIIALYFVLTVATPGKTLAQVTSAAMQFVDTTSHSAICRFVPADNCRQENTALVLVRMHRDGTKWNLTPIQDGFAYARDFGSLIPELKGYTRDLIPSIHIDPTERVAILRKGGAVRVQDYLPGHILPAWLTFGLAWDVTNSVNIDLDASALLLDSRMNVVDKVWFRNLKSSDGSIVHSGDEREGDEEGDDEKIKVNLNNVSQNVRYICFVLNSFSGQELDDVSKASCHLFDADTKTEVAKYTLTNTAELNRHTALLVACLFRENNSNEWRLWIMSQPGQGRTVEDNIDDVVNYLKTHSPPPVAAPITVENEEDIIVTAMPTGVENVEEEIAVIPMSDFLQTK